MKEESGMSKFLNMILRAREMMNSDSCKNTSCEKCVFGCKDPERDPEPLCSHDSVMEFVNEFYDEAAKDPMVQSMVLYTVAFERSDEFGKVKDELENDTPKLALKIKAQEETKPEEKTQLEEHMAFLGELSRKIVAAFSEGYGK